MNVMHEVVKVFSVDCHYFVFI